MIGKTFVAPIELGMVLAALAATQAIGCGFSGDVDGAPDTTNAEGDVVAAEQAVSIPANTIAWDWGNVSGVRLAEGDNIATVAPGAAVKGTASYSIDAGRAGCPGCISQIIMGVSGPSKECVYNGTGVRSGDVAFSLVAPRATGIYPVWTSAQWQYSCADALNLASDGSAVGLVAVYADPYDWSWGSVSSVLVNGESRKRVKVAPGTRLSMKTKFAIDAGRGGCPGCISQIVVGVEGGSKQCIYSGVGVVDSSATFTLEAPRQKGIYQVWVRPQWQYTCQDALNLSNDGTAVGFVEING